MQDQENWKEMDQFLNAYILPTLKPDNTVNSNKSITKYKTEKVKIFPQRKSQSEINSTKV